MNHSARDHERVRELLGREPLGHYDIVVRDKHGDPVVLRNAPFLDDGTPMPTLYWLVSPAEIRRIGQLESTGGVDAAESAVDAVELAAAHDRYAAERDAAIPADHEGPRPSGGVGGTRIGVKCLHAHWGWHLAGGDDPIGRWIEIQLADAPSQHPDTCFVELGDATTVLRHGGTHHEIPWGVGNLTTAWLADTGPPRPDSLTNALGTIADHLDDALRLQPAIVAADDWVFSGQTITSLAWLEAGQILPPGDVRYPRPVAEEMFRLVATESTRERASNPGLPSRDVDLIIATSCFVQACMRHLHLDAVTLRTTAGG